MVILCWIIYGLFGLVLGIRTNVFFFVQRDYLDAYTHIATLILVSGILMQFTLYSAGHLIEKIGYHRVLAIGLAISAVPLGLMLFVDSALFFDLNYLVLMLGFGIAMLTLNLFVSRLVPERKANALLVLHLFFSLGALAGPKFISLLTDAGISWQATASLISIPMLVILAVMAVIGRMAPGFSTVGPAMPEPAESGTAGITERTGTTRSSGGTGNPAGPVEKSPLRNPFVWLFIAAFVCSQIWEYGIGTWFVIFANRARGLSSSEAAVFLTIFYACYPLVRILFSRFIHNLNIFRVLFGAFISCMLFGGLGMLTGRLVFYSLTGAGISLMYPGLMAAMQQVLGSGATRTIGFITMSGGILQYVAIWSVGLISDSRGISDGFNSMLAYLAFGAITMLFIARLAAKKKV